MSFNQLRTTIERARIHDQAYGLPRDPYDEQIEIVQAMIDKSMKRVNAAFSKDPS